MSTPAHDPVAVLVFARAPIPGRVKTRLMPGLSATQAAALYSRMLERAVATAVASGVGPVELHCTPDVSCRSLRTLAARHGVTLADQHGTDLGERMCNALASATSRCGAALLMGSDAPMLDVARIVASARALRDGFPACFVPAVDGGYVLVGCARAPPRSLFDDMAWGTHTVMAMTRARMRALGWDWWEAVPVRDVDRIQDLALLPGDFPWP